MLVHTETRDITEGLKKIFGDAGLQVQVLKATTVKADSDVADLVEFLYSTGWRVSAGLGLEWRDVDLIHRAVTMRSELSRNKEPITLPFFAGIEDILQRRHGLRRAECPFVFHRNGRPIKDFRAEWAKATELAKRTGL